MPQPIDTGAATARGGAKPPFSGPAKKKDNKIV
jgi:hypothetical protein